MPDTVTLRLDLSIAQAVALKYLIDGDDEFRGTAHVVLNPARDHIDQALRDAGVLLP